MARLREFIPEERLVLARDLFWEKGFSATSMDDLVKATGLVRSSIYTTYGDKRALFILCLQNYFSFVEHDNALAIAAQTSPKLKLEKLIGRVLIRTMKSGQACMGVKSSFELGLKDPEIGTILQQAVEKNINVYTQLIDQAKAAGELSQQVHAGELAAIIQCFVTGIGQQLALGHSTADIKRSAKKLLKAFE